MRSWLFILVLVFISCHADEEFTPADSDDPTTAKALIVNNLPGCVTLQFPEIAPGRDHLQITNPYGWVINDTILTAPTFRVLKSLDPDQEYFYKVEGANPYEGSFRTASISSLIQGDYHLQVNKMVNRDQSVTSSTLNDALVEIIKISEHRILLFWPQRQSRMLDFRRNTCGAIEFSNTGDDQGVTFLNIRLESDSIFIHDRRSIGQEITEIYEIKGAFN